MALHQSLIDLGEQAPRVSRLPTAKGLLLEAQDFVRNALHHRDDEVALAAWFSRVVSDVVHSPALANATAQIRLTGSVALGDATPSCTVTWLGNSPELEELFHTVGLPFAQVEDTLVNRLDAGLSATAGEEELAAYALAQRPPALQLKDGLPDPHQLIDIKTFLLKPIQAVGRWAFYAPRPTLERLDIGLEREVLLPEEAEALTLAWKAGLALDMRAWLDGISTHDVTFGQLPALDRTAYGAACRMVAEAFDSMKTRKS